MPSHTETVAPGVTRLPILFVNAYTVALDDGSWVLVDTGLPRADAYVRQACDERLAGAPRAIILTHGHFDHAGNARALAEHYDVPIYAHRAELPFLTGRSDYPPADSSMGGAIAQLARAFPTGGYDFGERVRALPDDGSVPGLPGWRWLHTPGHTPGHVSLWRASDRTLLAGDALATMDLDSYLAQVTHARELARSPVPFVPDWDAAERSVRELADLRPAALGAGHGRAITDADLAERLERLASTVQRPAHGRYAHESAHFDERLGVTSVPPPVTDYALGRLAAGLGVIGLLIAGVMARDDRR